MEQLDTAQLLKKLQSQDGRKLMELLKRDGGAAFSKAAAAARSGNFQLAKTIMEPILNGTDAETLARSVGEENG